MLECQRGLAEVSTYVEYGSNSVSSLCVEGALTRRLHISIVISRPSFLFSINQAGRLGHVCSSASRGYLACISSLLDELVYLSVPMTPC